MTAPPGAAAGGLTELAVRARVDAGQVNSVAPAPGRSLAQILRANVLTRFNAILGALFVVVLVIGPPQDALFGAVLVVNTVIGVAQELRAKRALDRLAILTAGRARAIRDGAVTEIPLDRVVLDDVLELGRGDQVPIDGTVLGADGLELDEALLTGEAEPMRKQPGDTVLSGSAVVAGVGLIRADRVGGDAYAARLQAQARRFSLIRSELQQGTNQILRLVTWVMVPAGLLLIGSEFLRSHDTLRDAARGSAAGVVAMVPEGLVLLTSLAFAAGALRLARRRVLVQELAAIEGLARADVLCIDKTGTLTEPGPAPAGHRGGHRPGGRAGRRGHRRAGRRRRGTERDGSPALGPLPRPRRVDDPAAGTVLLGAQVERGGVRRARHLAARRPVGPGRRRDAGRGGRGGPGARGGRPTGAAAGQLGPAARRR
jgi:cation-transporting ATPase E